MRERILNAAEKLFLEQGYIGTTVEKIVTIARTSKREFYRLFPNREAVLLETVSYLVSDENSIMSVPTGRLSNVLAKAGRLMYLDHTQARAMGLFRASIAAAGRSPSLAVAAHRARSRATGLNVYLEEKLQTGKVVLDSPRLASIRFGYLSIDGLRFMIGASPLTGDELDVHVNDVVDVTLNGHATSVFRKAPDICLPIPPLAKIGRVDDAEISDAAYSSRLDQSIWDKLLDVAWEEFSANGFCSASVPAIAKNANFPRNTIYRRFKSKRELFQASAKRAMLQSFDVDFHQRSNLTVQDYMERVADHLLHCFLDPKNLALHKIMLAEAGREPEVMLNLYSWLAALMEQRLAPMLACLVEQGVIRHDVSAKAAWRFFILATFGSRFLFLPVDDQERRDLTKEAVRMFLFGFTSGSSNSDIKI